VNGFNIEPQPPHMEVIMTHVDIWKELRVLVSCTQGKIVSIKKLLLINKIYISKIHVHKKFIISYACMFKLNTMCKFKFKS
jgi:hypothetical protein